MINIVVSGTGGRMGSLILKLAQEDPQINPIGGLEKPDSSLIGKEINGIPIRADLKQYINEMDVLIEFTTPQATLEHLEIVQEYKKAIVIGTTGFTEDELKKIDTFTTQIPCIISPNMSIGVNLIFRIAKEITKYLKDYDVEVIEYHHHHKKDAPSGTAKKIVEEIAETLKLNIKDNIIHGREGITGPRPKQQIGVHAVRAGDIAGIHTILWAGGGEVIELTHRALSREAFASGAIKAAKFIIGKPAGKYNMWDVLEVESRV